MVFSEAIVINHDNNKLTVTAHGRDGEIAGDEMVLPIEKTVQQQATEVERV